MNGNPGERRVFLSSAVANWNIRKSGPRRETSDNDWLGVGQRVGEKLRVHSVKNPRGEVW